MWSYKLEARLRDLEAPSPEKAVIVFHLRWIHIPTGQLCPASDQSWLWRLLCKNLCEDPGTRVLHNMKKANATAVTSNTCTCYVCDASSTSSSAAATAAAAAAAAAGTVATTNLKQRSRRLTKRKRSSVKLGKWWTSYGYRGPSYCQRCSEVFRDHIVSVSTDAFAVQLIDLFAFPLLLGGLLADLSLIVCADPQVFEFCRLHKGEPMRRLQTGAVLLRGASRRRCLSKD